MHIIINIQTANMLLSLTVAVLEHTHSFHEASHIRTTVPVTIRVLEDASTVFLVFDPVSFVGRPEEVSESPSTMFFVINEIT